MTGFENDFFIVISRAPNAKNGATQWNCQCKNCGGYCIKAKNNLLRDKSCGCLKNISISNTKRKDLTNQRFGLLTAIKYTGKTNKSRCAIWLCQCDCGNTIEVDSNNLNSLHTTSCGCINYSIGAKKINDILTLNKINFKTEFSIKELFAKSPEHPLRFDFAIFDINQSLIRLIEYDGIQHYKETWGVWKTKLTLEEQQQRDKLKNEYAFSHNIPLVRIPYWERDNITIEMIMGDQYLIHK